MTRLNWPHIINMHSKTSEDDDGTLHANNRFQMLRETCLIRGGNTHERCTKYILVGWLNFFL